MAARVAIEALAVERRDSRLWAFLLGAATGLYRLSGATDDPDALTTIVAPEPVAGGAETHGAIPLHGVRLRSLTAGKLAVAMFLHHFSLGSWIVTLGSYVSANSGDAGKGIFTAGFVGIAYGAGPLGGMVAPFLTGLLADHWFATERIMCVLNLAGAAALCMAVAADSQGAFYLAMIGYFVCFIPSFALVSSMTFHHLERPAQDFPFVRAFSTMGWVAGGIFVGAIWPYLTADVIEATATPMKIGAVGGVTTAIFCLFLPHTPPANKRGGQATSPFSISQIFDLLRHRRFLGLLTLAMLAHCPSQFYYSYGNPYLNWTGMDYAAAKMSIGQIVEVGVMLLLPAMLLRISVKTSIVIGMMIWTVRFLMLAVAAGGGFWGDVLIYTAITTHGLAFVLVSISLQLDVDRCAGPRRRATGQGLLAVAMSGMGCYMGAQLAGISGAYWLPVEVGQAPPSGWQAFWMVPAYLSAGVVVLTGVLLRPEAGPPTAKNAEKSGKIG